MPTAYVLVYCELGYEDIIIDELKAMPQTIEASKIYGSSYDIIAKFTAEPTEKLRKVISCIRRIEKVKATQTMMVIEGQEER
ncbi:MAG: Lrp/AsnC ligand binding domain-containing protein [Nitrososphaeraceae archaeon]